MEHPVLERQMFSWLLKLVPICGVCMAIVAWQLGYRSGYRAAQFDMGRPLAKGRRPR